VLVAKTYEAHKRGNKYVCSTYILVTVKFRQFLCKVSIPMGLQNVRIFTHKQNLHYRHVGNCKGIKDSIQTLLAYL